MQRRSDGENKLNNPAAPRPAAAGRAFWPGRAGAKRLRAAGLMILKNKLSRRPFGMR